MAVFRPFKAVRPAEKHAAETAALPYDVYTRAEAQEAVRERPLSFLNIDRPETQFPENTDMYSPEVYQRASEFLLKEIRDGIYVRDLQPCFYIYEITQGQHTQAGLAGLCSIDDYLENAIRKHENTVPEKEADRYMHIDTLSAQTGPVLLAFHTQKTISSMIEDGRKSQPLYDFTAEDGVRHRVFRVSDPEKTREIEAAFAAVPSLYIADGHHRASAACRVGLKRREQHPGYDGTEEFNYFLAVACPEEEMQILPYNRIVTDLGGEKADHFLEELSSAFEEERNLPAPTTAAREKGEILMYLNGSWTLLTVKPEIAKLRNVDPVSALDVSLLQDEVLSRFLGIQDPKTDRRLRFEGGLKSPKELAAMVDQLNFQMIASGVIDEKGPAAAFVMHPTSLSELMSVADAGLLMPPKSTWFEPKLRSGIFIHEFER